jgi:hypothetical protein
MKKTTSSRTVAYCLHCQFEKPLRHKCVSRKKALPQHRKRAPVDYRELAGLADDDSESFSPPSPSKVSKFKAAQQVVCIMHAQSAVVVRCLSLSFFRFPSRLFFVAPIRSLFALALASRRTR